MASEKTEQEQTPQREKIRVIVKSMGDVCKPCKWVVEDAKNLADIVGNKFDIEVVEVKMNMDSDGDVEGKDVTKFFGQDGKGVAPVVVVESRCKSTKQTGYNRGQLLEMIAEVSCNGADGEARKG